MSGRDTIAAMPLPSPESPYSSPTAPKESSDRERLIAAEELVGPEWAEWYAMTPAERWAISERLFAEYLEMGGSLEPEVDTQSPFWSEEDLAEFARHRPIDRVSRRSEDRP